MHLTNIHWNRQSQGTHRLVNRITPYTAGFHPIHRPRRNYRRPAQTTWQPKPHSHYLSQRQSSAILLHHQPWGIWMSSALHLLWCRPTWRWIFWLEISFLNAFLPRLGHGRNDSSQGSLQVSPELIPTQPPAAQPEYSGDPTVLARLSALLEQGLAKASIKITTDSNQKFNDLGDHINAIENKLDVTIKRTNQNTDSICNLYIAAWLVWTQAGNWSGSQCPDCPPS